MRFTIKLKLALTFTVIIALAGAMAWFGVSGLGSINDTMEQMVRGPVQRSLLAADLRVQLLAIIRSEKICSCPLPQKRSAASMQRS